MKPIIIKLSNAARIDAYLDEVNGRAKTHVISGYYGLIGLSGIAETIERDLVARGLPKNAQKGARYVFTPGGPGKTYARKGRYVVTTTVRLERMASGWALISAEKAEIWADANPFETIGLTADQIARITEHALRNVVERKIDAE